jgi:hypothetical protein
MGIPLRVVVTGSRGKSSLVRLLHAGFSACGLATYARVTGVIPRELSPGNGQTIERTIRRTSPAHVREMLWWLSRVPADADAVVLENSAVSPGLQSVASELLSPVLVVWTTLRPDHVEAWGPGREGAARALMGGVPRGVPVAGGPELMRSPLPYLFESNGNALHVPEIADAGHVEANLALAALVCSLRGLDVSRAVRAMTALPPDLADFRVLRDGQSESDELAVAFSANDVESTERLFAETGWDAGETTFLFHHRPDREARLESFLPWIESRSWKEMIFTRQRRPLFPRLSPFALLSSRPNRNGLNRNTLKWNDAIDSPSSFAAWRRGRGRVFACGNVAGWPLEFLKLGQNRVEEGVVAR